MNTDLPSLQDHHSNNGCSPSPVFLQMPTQLYPHSVPSVIHYIMFWLHILLLIHIFCWIFLGWLVSAHASEHSLNVELYIMQYICCVAAEIIHIIQVSIPFPSHHAASYVYPSCHLHPHVSPSLSLHHTSHVSHEASHHTPYPSRVGAVMAFLLKLCHPSYPLSFQIGKKMN